jgi:uncharacterized protein with HEPN domain
MKALRNVLAHEYFGISTKIVWNIVSSEIPKVKEMVTKILQNEGDVT